MHTIVFATNDLLRVFWLTALSFVVSMALTPLLTNFLYSKKVWKRVKDTAITGEKAPVYAKLHHHKALHPVPTMAGVLYWLIAALVTLIFNLDRAGTWLPLFTLATAGALGLVDGYINIRSNGSGIKGLRATIKFSWLTVIAGLGAYWFFTKLGWDVLAIPGIGTFSIGWWYIPLFMLVILSSANAVNITDGLDGLAGGLLAAAFAAFAVIALTQGKPELAAFCGTLVGVVLAYTWFNIYPARFLMGDTGALAFGATLGVVAMLTNSALVLIVIGMVFVVETLSSIMQIASKKFFGRKILLSAPLHHHLEAIGWPETKVTMRFWVIGVVFAVIGLVIALFGQR